MALCLHSVILYDMMLYLSTRKTLTCVFVCFVSDITFAPFVSRFVIGGSVARVETLCHMEAGRDDWTSIGNTVFSVPKDNPLAGLGVE